MHAVILKCLFILVCRSKSPTGLMLHVVQYSAQNKISMSMRNLEGRCLETKSHSIIFSKLKEAIIHTVQPAALMTGY